MFTEIRDLYHQHAISTSTNTAKIIPLPVSAHLCLMVCCNLEQVTPSCFPGEHPEAAEHGSLAQAAGQAGAAAERGAAGRAGEQG